MFALWCIYIARAGIPIAPVLTNPGFLLAEMFSDERSWLMRGSQKKDWCGSLLTPLFRNFEIDLRPYLFNAEPEYINIPYLINCHILREESAYMFQDMEGNQLYWKLPQPEITIVTVFENLRFLPKPERLCIDPKAPRPDDDMNDVEDVTPKADIAYDLVHIEDATVSSMHS